jgi:heme A synthase
MSAVCSLPRLVPRWIHAWAILTVVATAILLALGGLVTTFRVGMADPVWPTTPWFLLFTSWSEPRPGFLIEHSHRLAGYVVGCLTIVLAYGMWTTARGRLRWLGIFCLLAVIAQGLLGGFRVVLNELAGTDLAAVHGVFAQLVFSLLVGAAVLSAAPSSLPEMADGDRRRCRRLAFMFAFLVFVQLIFGAMIRHNPSPIMQRLHLIFAFAVVSHFMALVKFARSAPDAWARLRRALTLLSILVVLQILLGVEAWMGKFATGVLPELQKVTRGQAAIRTAHVLTGTGILAIAIATILLTRSRSSISQDVAATDSQNNSSAPDVVGAHQLGGVS